MIDKIPELNIDIILKSDSKATLNNWCGSTIRGALSNSLMHRYCKSKDKNCSKCMNHNFCPVGIVFNTANNEDGQLNTNPVIINAFYAKDTITNEIKFNLVLFGNATMAIQNILIELLSGIELGRNRTVFKLKNAYYSGTDESIFEKGKLGVLKLHKYPEITLNSNVLHVKFESPMVCKQSIKDMSFKSFIRACLIRDKAIYNTLGIEIDFDYKDLLEKAENIEVSNSSLNLFKLARCSKTKQRVTEIAGKIGDITYTGDFSEFIPYISMAQEFNIGKWCTMGLGKFKVIEEGVTNEI